MQKDQTLTKKKAWRLTPCFFHSLMNQMIEPILIVLPTSSLFLQALPLLLGARLNIPYLINIIEHKT